MKPQHEKPLPLGRITLHPGVRYRVIHAFEDCDGKLHRVGEAWQDHLFRSAFTQNSEASEIKLRIGSDCLPYEF